MFRTHSSRWRSVLIGLTLLLVGLAPIVLAIVAYQSQWFVRATTTNHGELLQPMPALARAQIQSKQWAIWFVTSGLCQQDCQQTIDKLSRLFLILGNDRARVRLAITVMTGDRYPQTVPHLNWDMTQEQYAMLLKPSGIQPRPVGDIYLVDPMGNVFMRYEVATPIKSIFTDLQRVLKASRIG